MGHGQRSRASERVPRALAAMSYACMHAPVVLHARHGRTLQLSCVSVHGMVVWAQQWL